MNPGPPSAGVRPAEFEALYQRYNREVWALAYARWMDADTALDITQEAFLRLWKQWEAGEEIQNCRAWLLRACDKTSIRASSVGRSLICERPSARRLCSTDGCWQALQCARKAPA